MNNHINLEGIINDWALSVFYRLERERPEVFDVLLNEDKIKGLELKVGGLLKRLGYSKERNKQSKEDMENMQREFEEKERLKRLNE